MKKVLHIGMWSILGIALAAGLIMVNSMYRHTACKDIKIHIVPLETNRILQISDIQQVLARFNDSIVGSPLGEIELERIEKQLRQHPWIAQVHVSTSLDAKLHIAVTQRMPIARFIVNGNHQYYLDNGGKKLPVYPNRPAHVMVFSGRIGKLPADTIQLSKPAHAAAFPKQAKLYQVAQKIQQDPFMRPLIEQVVVRASGDLELIPKAGNFLICLGSPNQLQEKFSRLKTFYQEGIKRKGWNAYRSINLEYQNQIVCTKK